MIRFGKRLAKRTIFDYAQCRDESRYTDFVLADLSRQLEERDEELEARDAELAEAAGPKACGAYRIVHEDEYEKLVQGAKSAHDSGSSWESTCYRIVDDYNKLFATFINERSANAAKNDEIAKLKRAVDEAKAELRKSKRFYSNEAAYGADAVNGFSDDTTEKLAALAQQVLDNDEKISFAAACAVVLKRRLDDADFRSRTYSSKNDVLEKELKEARDHIGKMSQRDWLPFQPHSPWCNASPFYFQAKKGKFFGDNGK